LEILDEVAWRPTLVHIRITPRHALELPNREPQFFSRPGHTAQIENSVVGDHRFKAIRMSEHPIDHVATIGCSGRGHVVGAGVFQAGRIIHYGHNVVENLAAPIPYDIVAKFLAIAFRPARIRHDHEITGTGEYLCIPAVRPRLTPISMWTPMD